MRHTGAELRGGASVSGVYLRGRLKDCADMCVVKMRCTNTKRERPASPGQALGVEPAVLVVVLLGIVFAVGGVTDDLGRAVVNCVSHTLHRDALKAMSGVAEYIARR
jgi:hypothetical protein